MRSNRLKKALHQGATVFGMYSDTLHPSLVEMMARSGLDFVILDTEHNPYGLERCVDCIRAAESWGITPLVRVFENTPALINKALEAGAMGVIVPHVDTSDLAAQAVAAAKYAPVGIRGVYPMTRASGYASSTEEWAKVWREANEETMVVIQPLESESGLANLERILSVSGVDMVSLGIADLSQSIGVPMSPDDVRVISHQDRALLLCQQRGISAYALVSTLDQLRTWHIRGVKAFVLGSDASTFLRACGDLVEKCQEVIG